MIIAIGSTNPVKVEAVKEVLKDYSTLSCATVISVSVPSEISEQPLFLAETIQGAKNRARNAFANVEKCIYSMGLESGLFETPGSQTGFMDACVCAIYDGSNYYLGLSCGFEIPPAILELVLDKKMDLSQACYQAEICTNPNIGSAEGLIGILTKGRVTRKEYTKQCITTALIQIENADWYASHAVVPMN